MGKERLVQVEMMMSPSLFLSSSHSLSVSAQTPVTMWNSSTPGVVLVSSSQTIPVLMASHYRDISRIVIHGLGAERPQAQLGTRLASSLTSSPSASFTHQSPLSTLPAHTDAIVVHATTKTPPRRPLIGGCGRRRYRED